MTDDNDNAPTNDNGVTSDHDDELWFRRHLDPIAGGPVPDDWGRLRADLDRPATTVIGLGERRSSQQRGRLLAVAAVAAAVLLVAGATVLLNRDRATDSGLASTPPTTGFFVPTDLPDGWVLADDPLTTFAPSPPDAEAMCPCAYTTFVDAQGRRFVANDAAVPLDEPDDRPEAAAWTTVTVDELDDGRLAAGDGARVLTWSVDGRIRWLLTRDLTQDELIAIAEAWPAGREASAVGFEVQSRLDVPTSTRFREVEWTFRNETTGARIAVNIEPARVPWMFGTSATVPDGRDALVGTVMSGVDGYAWATWDGANLQATWLGGTRTFSGQGTAIGPGAAVGEETTAASTTTEAEQAEAPEPLLPNAPSGIAEDLLAVLGSMQPVTAAQWRAELAQLGIPDHEIDALATDTIEGWVLTDEPTDPGDPTQTTAMTQTTERITEEGTARATPAVQPTVRSDGPDDRSDELTVFVSTEATMPIGLDDIDMSDPNSYVTLPTVDVLLTNETGGELPTRGCLPGGGIGDWIAADGTTYPAFSMANDCSPTPKTWAPGEPQELTIHLTTSGVPAGDYRLRIQLEEFAAPFEIPVTLTP